MLFIALQAEGVFSTTAEAEAADLKNYKGLNYAAGDMILWIRIKMV
ncbi:MAG: hypothetical protein V8S95_01445 [Odoribacter sp.]